MSIHNMKKQEDLILDEIISYMDKNGYSKKEQIEFLKYQLSIEKAANKRNYYLSKVNRVLKPAIAVPILTLIATSVKKFGSSFALASIASLTFITYFVAKSYYNEKMYKEIQNLKEKQFGFEKVIEYQNEINQKHQHLK